MGLEFFYIEGQSPLEAEEKEDLLIKAVTTQRELDELEQLNIENAVAWTNIEVELKYLLDDTKYWIANETYPPDEIAIRFKHRLVKIHCFPNGNGRHSRLMADIIIESVFDKEVFSWHSSNMVKPDETRMRYIAAIRAGDNGNIQPLIEFARN